MDIDMILKCNIFLFDFFEWNVRYCINWLARLGGLGFVSLDCHAMLAMTYKNFNFLLYICKK